jgi:hypothetical protein
MKTKKAYTDEQKIYWDIEPHMLYDYVNFANKLRLLSATDDRYKKFSMEQDASRWFLIIFIELYQKSLEDLGVILLALRRRFNEDSLCKYQKKFSVTETPITFTQINYGIGEATIKKTLDWFTSERDLISGLHIDDMGKVNINLIFPELDLNVFYKDLYDNLVAWSKDQEKRFTIYNKIKHGPAIVGSAKIFNKKNENAPAVVYADPNANLTDHPLIVHSLSFKEDEFILLRGGVLKISQCIRDLISIYMCKNYPDFLKGKGFSSPLIFFKESRPINKY